jgi:two-component system chemotaxis response regulator CheB
MPSDIKVLVIDDSAFNRQTITAMLESQPGIRVVARAGDGDEGLKQVFTHAPDVITLDLEMPKMDGFTFLRILMSRRPTPVLVISSYARKENVFKALELGALDFIAKPTQKISPELREIERDLIDKVKLVTCLGASTGGPPALQQVFAGLDARLPMAVVVAQHMPAKFTQAFAERLDRASALEVREAKHGDVLRSGLALVAPGSGASSPPAPTIASSPRWIGCSRAAPTRWAPTSSAWCSRGWAAKAAAGCAR